jgi:hypothetical protein
MDQGIRQTSWNDTGPDQPHKEAPHICQDGAHIVRSNTLVVINYSHVPMRSENSMVPEASVLRKAFFFLVVLKVPYLMMPQVNTCEEVDTGNCWCLSVSIQCNRVRATTYHPSVNSIFADMFLLEADKLSCQPPTYCHFGQDKSK